MDTEQTNTSYRKIIHIDMDAFYASVEQRDFPEYRGKPIVVGGAPDRRGVVATASYEARKFGIRSAMSSSKAQQLCPDVLFVLPRFDAYKKVSHHIREIFRRFTDLIEPLSLDEAYLDVTSDKLNIGSAIKTAQMIKQAIQDELQLTASAGVSINKFVAKVASDMNKPNGLTFIGPSSIEAFLEQLPVEKFFGVGKVTAAKMKVMQLYTGADLKKLTEQQMIHFFGKPGRFYYKVVRGIDDREVQPHRVTKSLAAEDTFEQDLYEQEDLHRELAKIAKKVALRLDKYKLNARTLTLKVKFSDFKQITRNYSVASPYCNLETITAVAHNLLAGIDITDRKIRLLGISMSNFDTPKNNRNEKKPGDQLELF